MEEAFHTNFCGGAATLADRMVARGRGHLVAIGSVSSLVALPQAAELRMLAGDLPVDLASHG